MYFIDRTLQMAITAAGCEIECWEDERNITTVFIAHPILSTLIVSRLMLFYAYFLKCFMLSSD